MALMDDKPVPKTGWSSFLSRFSITGLLFLTVTGLAIAYAPFHATMQWGVLIHTAIGILALLPLFWYTVQHWGDYKRYNLSDALLLGYVSAIALVLCLVSGVVVTWQGLFGLRMAPLWRSIHLYSTWVTLLTGLPHVIIVWARTRTREPRPEAGSMVWRSIGGTVVGLLVIAGLATLYGGDTYTNEFPEDYSYVYGEDRPFAPSLAVTTTGGAFDAESLAGSNTCGTANCHEQILAEWKPSAHRYSAMDPLFQTVQNVMAEQNGPESTRYCGGCHDPISLFSGAKNIFAENLTELHGYNEGISCLICHGVRETDLQGNANYVMTQPPTYLWQWQEAGTGKFFSDFLIRTYPDQHNQLSKRMFKAPEYCAACHKQFIDQEVNRVGWVQLQNQYDNWKASHWFTENDPEKTVECRECHMPLVDSTDPAAGDETDYNRTADDGKHRSHRFIAANAMVPAMLELEGWEDQVRLTEEWLRGDMEIPEIQDKWRDGPVIQLALETPEYAAPGEQMPIRVVMTANKVGHDFPTGPLDIIQSWVELHVYDPEGNEIYATGRRDEKHFIEPGSFLFKAEPVDQYGNLIDRHNLWEMVGVRYRRALFPGYSDTVEYLVDCPTTIAPASEQARSMEGEEVQQFEVPLEAGTGDYQVVAKLMYRKVDQFLINFLLGEDSGLTAPVVQMTRAEATVKVRDDAQQARTSAEGIALAAPAGG
jgi:hypothetical protein